MYELYISHCGVTYSPVVTDNITLTSHRAGSPSCLKFSFIFDGISFCEGDCVKFCKDGLDVFFGYIFSLKSTKQNIFTATVYDQLRYFKNKDTYMYEGKKASEVLTFLIEDFGFNLGDIEDTGYVIPYRVEENSTLYDMVQNALDLTLENTSQMFILYDDCGKISLKNIFSMVVDLLIEETTAENFSYTSSIDDNTFNKVKLTYENADTGERNIFIAYDENNINSWGVLQYSATLKEGENGIVKAVSLMDLYDKKNRTLIVKNAFGDIKVRAGCLLVVMLDLGEVNLQSMMLVEKVTHNFSDSHHFMDLTLSGGEFNE